MRWFLLIIIVSSCGTTPVCQPGTCPTGQHCVSLDAQPAACHPACTSPDAGTCTEGTCRCGCSNTGCTNCVTVCG